mmetsp:Transcript_10165/g.16887  ORF Transcript_10165/g.16887 Transcript_10165/m.16887 type:complete len:555 (+) Transcript_10165:2-1666(+)
MCGGEYFVEPYRDTTLAISTSESSSKYSWVIYLEEDPKVRPEISHNGQSEVVVMFTKAGRFYNVEIEETTESGEQKMYKYQVICKYVRREIRTLSDTDREKYFYTLKQFHSLTMDEGKALYGDTFYNAKDLTIRHLATTSCGSPWHGGANFVSTHFAFVLRMEQVLQLIEPSVTTPYWNYILDAEEYGAGEWYKSEVWSEDYFGAFNADGQLEGKWTTLPIGRITDPTDTASTYNSYGIITGDHNQDNHFTLTRNLQTCGWAFSKINLPTCVDESLVLNTQDYTDFWYYADTQLHSNLHPLLGGASNCGFDAADAMMNKLAGDEDAQKVLEVILLQTLNYWEANIHKYNTPAAMADTFSDTPFEEVMLTFTNLDCTGIDSMSYETVYNWIDDLNLLNTNNKMFAMYDAMGETNGTYHWKHVDEDTNDFLMRAMLKLNCQAGTLTPMSSPLGSSADPIFGVAHSLFARHYSYLRLSNTEWNATFVASDDCYGQRPNDVMVWQGLLGEEGDDLHYYTQQELLEVFAPTNPALPFLHDSLDFSYCENGVEPISWDNS